MSVRLESDGCQCAGGKRRMRGRRAGGARERGRDGGRGERRQAGRDSRKQMDGAKIRRGGTQRKQDGGGETEER